MAESTEKAGFLDLHLQDVAFMKAVIGKVMGVDYVYYGVSRMDISSRVSPLSLVSRCIVSSQ